MLNYLYLIPLFSALTGWLSIVILIQFLFKRLLPSKQELIKQQLLYRIEGAFASDNLLVEKLQAMDLEAEITPVLDQRLDQFVASLGESIPMGNLFLGPLAQKVKRRIRLEILKMMPDLKARFVKRVQEDFDPKAIMNTKIQAVDIKQLAKWIYQEYKKEICQLQGLGALIGFGLGLLELLILLIIR